MNQFAFNFYFVRLTQIYLLTKNYSINISKTETEQQNPMMLSRRNREEDPI